MADTMFFLRRGCKLVFEVFAFEIRADLFAPTPPREAGFAPVGVGGIREIVTKSKVAYSTNSRFLYIPNESASSVHTGHKPHSY